MTGSTHQPRIEQMLDAVSTDIEVATGGGA